MRPAMAPYSTRRLSRTCRSVLGGGALACLVGGAVLAQEEAGRPSYDEISRLVGGLDADDEATRCRAARDLAKLGPAAAEAVPVLFARLGEKSSEVRDAALDAIGYRGVMSVEFESYRYYRAILGSDPARASALSMEQLVALEHVMPEGLFS